MRINKSLMVLLMVLTAISLMSNHAFAQWKSVKGNGNVVTQERSVGDFTGIKISCSADVILTQGDKNAVVVRTDENLLDLVETVVHGDVLHIDINGNIRNVEVLEVYVTVKNLQKVVVNGSGDVESENTIKGIDFEIEVNGSGDVELDLDVKSLTAELNGSGDVEISGVHGNFELSVRGSGDFDGEDLQLNLCNIRVLGSGDVKLQGSADKVKVEQSASGDINLYNLKSNDVSVSTAGSGDVVVFASGSLKVRLSGSGDLTYKGEPQTLDVSSTGSGDVYHR